MPFISGLTLKVNLSVLARKRHFEIKRYIIQHNEIIVFFIKIVNRFLDWIPLLINYYYCCLILLLSCLQIHTHTQIYNTYFKK